MKKLIAVSVMLILIAGLLAACGNEAAPTPPAADKTAEAASNAQHVEAVSSSGSKQPTQEQQPTVEKPTVDDQIEQATSAENEKVEEGIELIKAKVTKAVDGDTAYVKLESGKEEKVRFIGVDTPESTTKVEPYGKEATAYTKSKLLGKNVWLELDVQERDKYGRLLAYVWLSPPTKESDEEIRTKMFNAVLLLEGYAQVMTVPPNVKYAEYFGKYQQEAREKKAGLWGSETKKESTPYSKIVPKASGSYIGNKNSKKFHLPTCYWAKKIAPGNKVYSRSRSEAIKAGYQPCKVCKP